MNTEFSALPEIVNPFAAFMDASASVEAHERLSGRVVQSVIHRPLDERLFRQLGIADAAELDADIDVESDCGTGFGALN